MNILVVGELLKIEEFNTKFKEKLSEHTFVYFPSTQLSHNLCHDKDIIFDLDFDSNPEKINIYANLSKKIVFVSAVKIKLSSLFPQTSNFSLHTSHFTLLPSPLTPQCILFGLNCLPGFINRNKLEISMLNPSYLSKLQEISVSLGFEYFLVQDKVGMVSPRVICMLINEAFYTLEEGTATVEDIDLSMKQGTNYPYGPFEWAKIIGVKNVYEVLNALHKETHDPRYNVCSLLK